MHGVIARKVVAKSYCLRISQRILCSDATAKVSIPDCDQHVNELKKKMDIGDKQFDIAIVGGGMVGLAFVCSLAKSQLTKHLKVAIIDSNPIQCSRGLIKNEYPPDSRVSTVTPATIAFFKDIGAWTYIEQQRHAYFDKMQVWDYTGLGYTRYNAKDVNKKVLGCVVENKVLLNSLFSCLEDTGFQKTIYPSRLCSIVLNSRNTYVKADNISARTGSSTSQNLARLELNNGTSLEAKLVIGADGSKSHVRELAGFRTTGWNYSQDAIICSVEHTTENHCAWQRFLPSGPIALLPMGDNFSNIVWTMNSIDSSEHKTMNESDFVKAINHALECGYGPYPKSKILGIKDMFSWLSTDAAISANEGFEVPPKVTKLVSERMAFPLSLKHANEYAKKRVVLIGDAAHSVHPLAGQGVNLGFGDALTLAKVIAEGIAVGADIGEVSLLKKYEGERKPANISMMAILDVLQKAYSIDFGPLNLIRAAAFQGAHHIPPLKKRIISYASGDRNLPFFS